MLLRRLLSWLHPAADSGSARNTIAHWAPSMQAHGPHGAPYVVASMLPAGVIELIACPIMMGIVWLISYNCVLWSCEAVLSHQFFFLKMHTLCMCKDMGRPTLVLQNVRALFEGHEEKQLPPIVPANLNLLIVPQLLCTGLYADKQHCTPSLYNLSGDTRSHNSTHCN